MEYLVIGNSAAGLSAVKSIRKKDKNSSITLFSDEPYPYYSRLLIPYFIRGNLLKAQLFEGVKKLLHDYDVRVRLGDRIVEISSREDKINSLSGHRFSFDRLLVATGAFPVIPDIPGKALPGVFPVRTLEHAERICSRIKPEGRATILGGGLVGIQLAQALSGKGMDVTVVVGSDRVLSRNLDSEGSRFIQIAAQRMGIKILLGREVEEISQGHEGTVWMVFKDGERMKGDLILWAKGVEPSTELLRGANLPVSRGAVVNGRLQTIRENVFAAGDLVEFYDLTYQEKRNSPIWPNAIEQGCIAGLNMTGMEVEYRGGIGMNVTELFGIKIASIGKVESGTEAEAVAFLNPEKGMYRKIVMKNNLIEGAILMGDISDCGVLHRLIKNRSNVGNMIQRLINQSARVSNGIYGGSRLSEGPA